MATRLYLHTASHGSKTTSTQSSVWDTTTYVTRNKVAKTERAGGETSTNYGTVADTDKTAKGVLFYQAITEYPLLGQTISSGATFKLYARCYENHTQNNLYIRWAVWIMNSDGTLGNYVVYGTGGTELAVNTLTNRGVSAATSGDVVVTSGQYLVVDVGVYGDPGSSGTGHQGYVSCGNPSSTNDLPEDQSTTTDYNPWIECSQTLNFSGMPQTLTQTSRFDNSNTLNYVATLLATITLSQTSTFANDQTYYTHQTSQGGAQQDLVQTARYDNEQTYYTHTQSNVFPAVQSVTFSNGQTWYVHTQENTYQATQSARYDNDQTWWTHQTSQAGPQTLEQTARFDNGQGWFTHSLSNVYPLTQTSRYDNSQSWFTHTLLATRTLTQTSRHDNSQSWFTHTLLSVYPLTQSSRYDNSQSWYTHTLSAVNALTPSRYDNSQTWYTHTTQQTGPQNLVQTVRFDNAQGWYTHSTQASYALTQSVRYDNSQSFFTHSLSATVSLVQSARLDNQQTFFSHVTQAGGTLYPLLFVNTNTFFEHATERVGKEISTDSAITLACELEGVIFTAVEMESAIRI